jgi:hypothetical protein
MLVVGCVLSNIAVASTQFVVLMHRLMVTGGLSLRQHDVHTVYTVWSSISQLFERCACLRHCCYNQCYKDSCSSVRQHLP